MPTRLVSPQVILVSPQVIIDNEHTRTVRWTLEPDTTIDFIEVGIRPVA